MTQENGSKMKIKSGVSLYNYAKKIIPGGTTLFSKRSELYLPNKWPAYFIKAKEIFVWDLKRDKYLDMYCAVGTSVLGYCNKRVNNSILKNINKGNLTTLNCPEEVILANKIIKHHPWADMAKFTRGGGEANAVAIRIARANTKKKNVAFCGYHGWHDWFIATTDLNGGIPKFNNDLIHKFNYNDLDSLEKIFKKRKNKIAAVMMEPLAVAEPNCYGSNNCRKKAC